MSRRFRQFSAAIILGLASLTAYGGGPTIVYYDIVGNTERDLRRELDNKGPVDDGPGGVKFDGHTRWYVNWSYRYRPVRNGCMLTGVEVTTSGVITLPRWNGAGNSDRLSNAWQQYMESLRLHEDGHYANGVMAAQEIDRLGQSFRARSCENISVDFDRRAAEIIEKYRAADVAYDRETDHGRTQGARFPLGGS